MKAIVIPYSRTVPNTHAPLRRSMPSAGTQAPTRARHWPTALLAFAGVVLFVDVEFALAYLLYFATRLVG